MSEDLTVQMLTPSLRRVYTSRAFLIAISASGACRLPTCLCASPCWLRMNTSHNGHSFMSTSDVHSSRRLRFARGALFGMGEGRLAHPRSLVPGLDAGPQSLAVARPVALDD